MGDWLSRNIANHQAMNCPPCRFYSSAEGFYQPLLNLRRPEVWKRTTILTAGRKCLLSHGVGSITLTVTNRNPLKTNVLVVNSKPLGFNLLLGMDVIKKLGCVHINDGEKAHFAEAEHTLGKTDFRTEFDQRTKSWTVSWKRSGDQPPEK